MRRDASPHQSQSLRVAGYAVQYWQQLSPRTELQVLRDKAIDAARTVHSLSPGSAESELASGYLNYFIEEDFPSALRHFQSAASLRPSDSAALEALGSVQGQLGMFQEAVETLERAFSLDPLRGALAREIAAMYYGLGRTDEAQRWIDQAIKIDPTSVTPYEIKASFLNGVGEAEEARSVLTIALRMAPWVVEVHVAWITYVYLPARDFDSVVKRISFITGGVNEQFSLRYARAVALTHGQQDAPAAAAAWNDLLEFSRGLGDFYKPLASMHAYAGLGQTDSLVSAVEQLERRVGHRVSGISPGTEIIPTSTVDYPSALFQAAVALTRGGLYAEALDRLEELSELTFRSSYSHPAMFDYVYFDPLRDNPRFQALVENWDRRGRGTDRVPHS